MKRYEYIPKKDTKRLTKIVIALAVGGTVLFLLPIGLNIPFEWLSQMLGVSLITGMIFIISRCIAKTFIYAIVENDENKLDLTVTETDSRGKKHTTVCRVALSGITEAYLLCPERPEEKEKIKELTKKAKDEQRKIFSYNHDINPTPICLLFLEECGEPLFIKLSPDQELFGYFERACANRSEEQEEQE